MARKVKVPSLPDFGDFVQYDEDVNSAYDENGNRYRLRQHNRSLGALTAFSRLALFNRDPLFVLRMNSAGKYVLTDSSKLARYFGAIHILFDDLYSTDPLLSPDITLFFMCYRKHRIRHCPLKNKNSIFANGGTEGDVYEDFIRFYRAEAERLAEMVMVENWLAASPRATNLDPCPIGRVFNRSL